MMMLGSGLQIPANGTISISETTTGPINEIVILETSEGPARPEIFTLVLQTHDDKGGEVLRVIPLTAVASEKGRLADLVSGTFETLPPGAHRWLLRSAVATTVHVGARAPSMENAPEVVIGLFPMDGRMAENLLAHLDVNAGLDEHSGRLPWRWSVIRIWGDDAPEILASGTPIIVLGNSPHDDAVVTLLATRAQEPPAPTFFYTEGDTASWGALIDWCRAQEPVPDDEDGG